MLTEAMLTDMGWTPALIAQRVRCLTVEDVLTGFRSCAGEEFWTADSVERAFRSDARAPGEALRGMMLAARAAALGGAGYVLHGLDYGDGEGPVKGRMVVPVTFTIGQGDHVMAAWAVVMEGLAEEDASPVRCNFTARVF